MPRKRKHTHCFQSITMQKIALVIRSASNVCTAIGSTRSPVDKGILAVLPPPRVNQKIHIIKILFILFSCYAHTIPAEFTAPPSCTT